ncbi:hypothetical protein B0A52_03287 [Exophiala mesophila]|uniref:CASTOR ACT domain-containing protein n=1 Tax=Exophiala mesophila TaxID=212818 RepID=A0A438NAX8_EXOME|nr:hypothetical protein B0A52_03287 [Exophiala mesophila]
MAHHDQDAAKISWTNRHDFLNVSVTPVECSIICSRYLADCLIRPVADVLNKAFGSSKASATKSEIQISDEDYIVIQVDGSGLEAGQRVLELTSPLAMAGISIFFITTYFSDYILVPSKARRTVTKALQQRGFIFSQSADAFVSQLSPASPNPTQNHASRITSPFYYDNPTPTTPPARDIPELQVRTFTKLKRNNITPQVDQTISLVSCAGSREFDVQTEQQLKNDLLQVLLSTTNLAAQSPPWPSQRPDMEISLNTDMDNDLEPPNFGAKFLSLTITSSEPISVLLEDRLLPRLGDSLLGAKSEEDALIPIILDLRDLPLEATGIVCGVAGRLAQGASEEGEQSHYHDEPSTKHSPTSSSVNSIGNGFATRTIDISFLSTARAGTVIVKASQLENAIAALEFGMNKIGQGD